MQLAFGAGALWGNRTDVTGGGIGPDQFGILQDVQIDFDWTTKELWGQFQFPVDIARGQGKIAGKAKFARIFGAIFGDLFFGQTPAAGQLTVAENEAATVPATTPFTIAVANAASFADDLGVDPPPPKWSTLSYGLAKEDRDAEEELQAGRDRRQAAAG